MGSRGWGSCVGSSDLRHADRPHQRGGRGQRAEDLVHERVPGILAICAGRDFRISDAGVAAGNRRLGAALDGAPPGARSMSIQARNPAATALDDNGGPSGQASSGRVNPPGVDTTYGAILYLDGITVSFDGFKALNALTLDIGVGALG